MYLLLFLFRMKSPIPSKSTDRSIDRVGIRGEVCVRSLSISNLWRRESIDRSIDRRDYCERKSSLLKGWEFSVLSSEIRWIFAINVSFDSPALRAWWTAWIKRSKGVGDEDDEDPIEEEIGAIEIELPVVKGEDEGSTMGTCRGRSSRGNGLPNASSPLSRIGKESNFCEWINVRAFWRISWAMATEVRLNFWTHKFKIKRCLTTLEIDLKVTPPTTLSGQPATLTTPGQKFFLLTRY